MLKELVIDRESSKTVSRQIANYFRCKIENKEMLPGEKIPTTLELVKQFGVGTHSIRKAMYHLSEEGLVTSLPKLGTIVTNVTRPDDMAEEASPALPVRGTERVIAVSSLLNAGDSKRFRPETAAGIITECDRLGVSVVVLPSSDIDKSPELLYQKLKNMGCSGLIFQGGAISKPDYLIARGIEVITSRRCKCRDSFSCIESDYDGAGYDVGLYYYAIGCDRVAIFSHFELSCDTSEAIRFGYPIGIKHGVCRAFDAKGMPPQIDFYVNQQEDSTDTSRNILLKLQNLLPKTGIVFTNGYQLLNLLKEYPVEAKRLLEDKKFTVISNKTINKVLVDYVGNIEFMVLLDLFEEIARQMVGKLLGMIEGYLPRNSTTLTEVKFLSFKDAIEKY